MGARKELVDDQVGMWAILASRDDLLQDDLRYGLSMLALAVAARKKGGYAVVILQTEGDPVTADDLPTALKNALVLPAADAGNRPNWSLKYMPKRPHCPQPMLWTWWVSMGMKSVPLMGKQKCTTSQLKRSFCTGLAAGPGGQ